MPQSLGNRFNAIWHEGTNRTHFEGIILLVLINLFSHGQFIVSRSCDSVQVHRAKYRWFANDIMAAMLVVMNKLNCINFSCKLFVKNNFIDHQHDCPVAMWLQGYKQGDKPTEE